ncbi:transposase [Streptomyces sp. NPDC094038]|uniref:transposase n=1 Tax=Streptomyces sp. NPDC094038 TaxID=3366055 RepID=UPI00381CF3AA
MQRRAPPPVRITLYASALTLVLEPPCPLGEAARTHPVSPFRDTTPAPRRGTTHPTTEAFRARPVDASSTTATLHDATPQRPTATNAHQPRVAADGRAGTMPASRKYPDELRERAVREVRTTGRPIAHVAKDLGIHEEALRGRVRQAGADHGEACRPAHCRRA